MAQAHCRGQSFHAPAIGAVAGEVLARDHEQRAGPSREDSPGELQEVLDAFALAE